MSGDEFFYRDKDGKKQDAALHEPILAAGDHAKAQQVAIEAARRAGLRKKRSANCMRPWMACQIAIRFKRSDALVRGAVIDAQAPGSRC